MVFLLRFLKVGCPASCTVAAAGESIGVATLASTDSGAGVDTVTSVTVSETKTLLTFADATITAKLKVYQSDKI